MSKLTPKIVPGDWNGVAHAIAKLDQKLNSGAAPTFNGLTLTGPLVATDITVSGDLTVSDLTASRLMFGNGSKIVDSVEDLTAWIAGTAGEIVVTDDTDGSVTLSLHSSVGDHGSLIGLGDDDHTQYHNDARAVTWLATQTIAIANGGTGQTTAQAAIDSLTDVSGATVEHVLTKDTVTGNAIWKVNSPGVTDHGALTGLGDVEDHLLYLDLAGTRAMTGDLDMDANEILSGNVIPDADDTYDLGDAILDPPSYNLEISQPVDGGTVSQFGASIWTAQTFTTVGAFNFKKAVMRVRRTGSGNLTCHLRATAAGLPTGADLASITIDGNSITTDSAGELVDFVFAAAYALSAATVYAICFSTPIAYAYLYKTKTANPYAGGQQASSGDSGSTWGAGAYYDAEFYIYSTVSDSYTYTRWGDLYLSGNLDDGTDSLTVANAKAAYDHIHNLTTDIDHDALTNFVADEHIDWKDTSEDLHTSGAIDCHGRFTIGDAVNPGFPFYFYTPTTNAVACLESGDSAVNISLADNNSTLRTSVGVGAIGDNLRLIASAGGGVRVTIRGSNGAMGIGDESPEFRLTITNGTFGMQERSADATSVAGYGQLWVKDDTPCMLKYTDDADNIFDVAMSDGDTGGSSSAGSGNQYVEISIGGTIYKVLHDGTV